MNESSCDRHRDTSILKANQRGAQCPLLALSGHAFAVGGYPLLRVKRTFSQTRSQSCFRAFPSAGLSRYDALSEPRGEGNETARQNRRQKKKTQRRKTLKRGSAPKTARRRNFSAADLQEQVDALTLELQAAREQQTATSDVLRII